MRSIHAAWVWSSASCDLYTRHGPRVMRHGLSVVGNRNPDSGKCSGLSGVWAVCRGVWAVCRAGGKELVNVIGAKKPGTHDCIPGLIHPFATATIINTRNAITRTAISMLASPLNSFLGYPLLIEEFDWWLA